MTERVRVGYAGVSLASYFAQEHGQYGRAIQGLQDLSTELGFELVPIRYAITDVALAEQAAGELLEKQIDFLLLQTAAVGMGDQLLALVGAASRLGLWATPEPHLEGEIQLHSLVSMSHYASILKRYLLHDDIPFKWFYGHVEEEAFQRRFAITIRALTAIKNMAAAKIGWVGGLSPGFYNMTFDERKLRARLGTRVVAHELGEVVALAKQFDDQEVVPVVGEMRAAASEVRVADQAMVKGGRLYLALKQLARQHDYQALAVECWPKFQSLYGVAPCLAYSWLGSEDGLAVACEGDVLGATSMLLLNYLTGKKGSSTLLDLAAIDPKTHTVLMWHCGVSPRHLANPDGIKWVNHTTLGRKSEVTYGVAGDQVFAPQDMTITYVGDDAERLLVLYSHVIEREEKGHDGTRGWFSQFELNQEQIDLWDLINTLTVRGHQHHYAVGQGNVSQELMEVAAWLKMKTLQPVPYRDYLQVEGINA